MTKSVSVAIVGSPNVGKSSLLNCMIGKKNSIVSPTPHTTRDAILGVHNINDTQILFIDTPGYIKKGSSIWSEHFIAETVAAVNNVDLILIIIDASRFSRIGTSELIHEFAKRDNTIIAINKVDARSNSKLYPIANEVVKDGYQDVVFLVSARTGQGVDDLINHIQSKAVEGEWKFTGNDEVQMIKEKYGAECVREKVFYCTSEEIPFGITTSPVHWSFRKNKSWSLSVQISVAKESHKAILIGARGSMIKKIRITAQTELESIWGAGQLFLNVAVDSND